MSYDSRSFALLEELEADNSKAWYDAHRTEFAERLLDPFAATLEAASQRLADAPVPLSGDRSTMFRMNRDTRFSKDKRPYKTAVSGLLSKDGTKAEAGGLVYLHLDARGGFAAAGYYNLAPAALAPMRDRIVADPDGFRSVVQALEAAGLPLTAAGALKTMPRGYAAYAEADFAPWLRLTSFMVQRDLARADWLDGRVPALAAELGWAAAPLFHFFGR